MKRFIIAMIIAGLTFLGCVMLEKTYGDQGEPLNSYEKSTDQATVLDSGKMAIYPPAEKTELRVIFWGLIALAFVGIVGMIHRIVLLETKDNLDLPTFRKHYIYFVVSFFVGASAILVLIFISALSALFVGVVEIFIFIKGYEAFTSLSDRKQLGLY